jgi:hypothetical protein
MRTLMMSDDYSACGPEVADTRLQIGANKDQELIL